MNVSNARRGARVARSRSTSANLGKRRYMELVRIAWLTMLLQACKPPPDERAGAVASSGVKPATPTPILPGATELRGISVPSFSLAPGRQDAADLRRQAACSTDSSAINSEKVPSRSLENGSTAIGGSNSSPNNSTSETVSGFPDSPPYPTTFTTIPSSLLHVDESSTLGNLGDEIGEALEGAGFSRTYYRFRDGFAVVACIEQIDGLGHSLPPPDRFSLEVAPMQSFTLAEYFSRLINAHPGHFRLFVITVSSNSFQFGSGSLSEAQAIAFIKNGTPNLVGAIRNAPVPRSVTCVALVYEFYKSTISSYPVLSNSPLVSAREHLRLAGIWNHIQ